MMVIEGHLMISQLCMDEMLRSVVLPFCAKTSGSNRPRMTMSEHTSLESAKTMFAHLLVSLLIRYVHNFIRSMTYLDKGSNA